VSTEGTVVFFGLGVPRTPMNWSSSWEKKSFMDISANVSVSSFGLSSFDRLDGGVQTDDGDERLYKRRTNGKSLFHKNIMFGPKLGPYGAKLII